MADTDVSIFVGGVSWETTSEQVEEAFRAKYRTVVSVKLIADPMFAARHRGYGFVRFSDPQEAQHAIQEMNGFVLNGMKLRVGASENKSTKSAQPTYTAPAATASYYAPHQQYPSYNPYMMGYAMPAPALPYAPPPKPEEGMTTLFAGGVDASISDYDLFLAFSTVGPISSIKIASGKACAFIQFQYHAHAERAIITLQGLQLGSSKLRLAWGRTHTAYGAGDGSAGVEGEVVPKEPDNAEAKQPSQADFLNKVFSAAPIVAAPSAPLQLAVRTADEEYSWEGKAAAREELRHSFAAMTDDGDPTKAPDITARNNAWAHMYSAVSVPINVFVPRGARELCQHNVCTFQEQGWPSDLHDTIMAAPGT